MWREMDGFSLVENHFISKISDAPQSSENHPPVRPRPLRRCFSFAHRFPVAFPLTEPEKDCYFI